MLYRIYSFISLDIRGCICHFTKWQIHPFISKETVWGLCIACSIYLIFLSQIDGCFSVCFQLFMLLWLSNTSHNACYQLVLWAFCSFDSAGRRFCDQNNSVIFLVLYFFFISRVFSFSYIFVVFYCYHFYWLWQRNRVQNDTLLSQNKNRAVVYWWILSP